MHISELFKLNDSIVYTRSLELRLKIDIYFAEARAPDGAVSI